MSTGLNDGMPVGLQIMGRAFNEATVLKAGRLVEENDPLAGQRVPVCA